MADLVYPREKSLGLITLVLGLVAWLVIILATLGTALIYLLFGFIFYLFAQSGLIAWLRGTGVRLSDEQFPDLYLQYLQCCKKLGMVEPPEVYILQGDGIMNAFATRFLGRNFVIVLTDTLDAMREQPDGINFYFGHELGHIKQGHLTGHFWRMPVLWLPLIGAAYSRAAVAALALLDSVPSSRAPVMAAPDSSRQLISMAFMHIPFHQKDGSAGKQNNLQEQKNWSVFCTWLQSQWMYFRSQMRRKLEGS